MQKIQKSYTQSALFHSRSLCLGLLAFSDTKKMAKTVIIAINMACHESMKETPRRKRSRRSMTSRQSLLMMAALQILWDSQSKSFFHFHVVMSNLLSQLLSHNGVGGSSGRQEASYLGICPHTLQFRIIISPEIHKQ